MLELLVAVESAWVVDPVVVLEHVVVEQQMHLVHHELAYPSVVDLLVHRVVDLLVVDLLVHHLELLLVDRLHQQVEVHLLEAFLVQI